MKYRNHKELLSESMETVQEFNTIEELKQYLNISWKQFNTSIAEIKFEYCCYDQRINWNTYYVMQRLENQSNFIVVGMSDGIFTYKFETI